MKEHVVRQDMPSPTSQISPITLRIVDACRVTGIGRSKLYELIKAGDIETIKIGRITLVPMASIEALLARGQWTGSGPIAARRPKTQMHPSLTNAVIAAALAGTPDHVRHALLSSDEAKRAKGEDAVVERIVGSLFRPD